MAERAAKTAPTGPTELWYRRMLLVYPADYRRQFADEMLEILMQIDDPTARPARASAGELWALFRHGLQMRLKVADVRGTWRRPSVAAAAVLAVLVAVIGAQTLIGSGWGYLMTDAADRSSAIDPLWGMAALSLLTCGLLLVRQTIPAVIAAWAAVGAGVWSGRTAIEGLTSWGPPSVASLTDMTLTSDDEAGLLALLVPVLVLALLLLRPGTGALAVELVGRATLLRALAAGTLITLVDEFGIYHLSLVAAPVGAGIVLLVTLFRERVLLRVGLLVAFAFGYLVVAGLADGSGSGLPHSGLPLTISVAALPALAFLAGVLVVSQVDTGTRLGDAIRRRIQPLGRPVSTGSAPGQAPGEV